MPLVGWLMPVVDVAKPDRSLLGFRDYLALLAFIKLALRQ